jgi:hypothetical protein
MRILRGDDTDAHPEPSAERDPHHGVGTMPEPVAAIRELTGAKRPVNPARKPL